MEPRPVTGSNSKIIISQPLTIVGVIVAILREHFAEEAKNDPTLLWTWKESLLDTDVFIESGWNEHIEARNIRPGIWVDFDQNVFKKVTLGDRGENPEITRVDFQTYYAHGELDIDVQCTAAERGESIMLASAVQNFMQMSSDVVQATYYLRDISPILMNKAGPFEKDTKLWTTPVTFRVQYEVRWSTVRIARTLRNLAVRVTNSDDPDTYYQDLALRSVSSVS